MDLTNHFHLVQNLKKGWSSTSAQQHAFMSCTWKIVLLNSVQTANEQDTVSRSRAVIRQKAALSSFRFSPLSSITSTFHIHSFIHLPPTLNNLRNCQRCLCNSQNSNYYINRPLFFSLCICRFHKRRQKYDKENIICQ